MHSCTDARARKKPEHKPTHICMHFFPPPVHALVRSFSAPSPFALFTAVSLRLPLMPHSEHEHPESASLDTAAQYSAPRSHSCSPFLSPSLSSPTLNSPDPPPSTHYPLSLLYSELSFSLPPSVALHSSSAAAASAAAASALCAPLSLRGSPLIALHITLNHHNNKSTLSQTNHLEGPVLKILR